MNKYQKTLEYIERSLYNEDLMFENDDVYNIEELVEKATPKILVKEGKRPYCPNCDELIYLKKNVFNEPLNKYCQYCGQALDWTKYEEEVKE